MVICRFILSWGFLSSIECKFYPCTFSTLSKSTESTHSCSALLHDTLELFQKASCSMNSAPGEVGQNIKCKLKMVLNSNPVMKKIQPVSQCLSEMRIYLSDECSEPSAQVYKYCLITSVDVIRPFSVRKLILTNNIRSLSVENIERLVTYCDATFCSE
ncbi:hypothetical protein PR048_019490, partial [Dryococelus australis]